MNTLYFGGPILTMETPSVTEAVLVCDGVVAAVGARAMAAAQNAQRFDLQGRTLMPAFLDAHSHFSQMAMGELQVNLDGAEGIEEIERRISDFLHSHSLPQEAWVQASGYDPGSDAYPSLAQLDAWGKGHPLVLIHRSGHVGLCNSLALARLQITGQTPDPPGGKIGRKDGALTGYLEENAFTTALRQIPLPDWALLREAYRRAQQRYASFGITTIQEGAMLRELIAPLRQLRQEGGLMLDLVAYADPQALSEIEAAFPDGLQTYHEHFRLGGLKIFLDGSPQARTAWLQEPYEGSSDCGYGTMSDKAVLEAFRLAARRKMQLLAHCNGDAACEQFLRCLEIAEQENPVLSSLRPVMVHAQLVQRAQLARLRRLGAIPSFFNAHVWYWGKTHLKNLGANRAARLSPCASALARGLRFTLHQDAPVVPPDMLHSVWCAVERRTQTGEVLGPEERIGVLDALRAVTLHAAWQYFEEGKKGSIRPGKRADFVLLDADPLTAPPEQLRRIRILQTICADQTIYST